MQTVVPYTIAFILGAMFSILDVVSVKYHKISAFIYNSISLYVYAGCYGLFAILILALFSEGILKTDALTATIGSNVYLQAAMIGIFTKAFFDIKIFSFSISQDRTFPVGIKTFSHFIEDPLLSNMEIDWFKSYSRFIAQVESKYPNRTVIDIHNLAVDKLRAFPDTNRVVVFLKGEFDKATDKRDKYSLVMRDFGKDVFCQVFDC
jgi:hypothetical protein